MTTAQPAFWERASFRAVAEDGAWRPGGLAPTRRALDWCEERGLLAPGALVADCGCGAGATLGLLAERGYRAVGLDRRIDEACLPAASFLVVADIAQPPLSPACADMVLFECVLSLLNDPGAALRAARECLKPGGLCLVSDLTLREGEATAASGVSCLSGARPEAEWRGLLEAAGFCLLLAEDHSRALSGLAAKMLWYGGDASGLSGEHCACGGPRRRFGYGLWMARKNDKMMAGASVAPAAIRRDDQNRYGGER